MFGLCVIAVFSFISIAGYNLTSDKTPYANDQKPELHIRKPGFNATFLQVRKNTEADERSFFGRMLFGQENLFESVALYRYEFKGPNVLVEEYTGNMPNDGAVIGFNIADVVYSIDTQHKIEYDSTRREFSFYETGGSGMTVRHLDDLQKEMVQNNLVTKRYLLGTDLLGRDLLSRLLIGTRISLSVGLISVAISISLGLLLGSLGGYFRGKTDLVITWLINVVWSIPTLLLVIAITLVLGKGITQVFIAVGLTMWVDVARIVRGQILSLREKEFVEAGKALGFTHGRIIFRHVLPNVMGPVVVMAASNFASAILMEAGLSFLGLGAQPPIPSWGEMINAHRGYILMDKAYLAFIPGFAIMLLVLSFMLVGNGLRDAMDTRLSDSQPLA